ncbi:MAG: diaminopimelate dehydrogenase [Bacteroidales bacterium]|jgi:diaminopimelate dehydrogenase|nr:diaminopimelate dehydrogenase [Bacteroidales bacterium]
MNKKSVAIVGYGNIGYYSLEALSEAPDMELAGVVRRAGSLSKKPSELEGVNVVSDIKELGKVDVAILCGPSRSIPETAVAITSLGINTVDSFDIHGESLWNLRQKLNESGKAHNTVSILSAGWDPGSDSMVRILMQAMAPKGITYTNFGPGMSMGHTVAVKSKEGVKNALSMTIPAGTGIHRRLVYIELEEGADFSSVEKAIKTDAYFAKDETVVTLVPSVDALLDMGHGVLMERKGVSGKTQNQLFQFSMKINNPALTGQILVAAARATFQQKPGAYTLPEIPVMDLLPGDRELLIKTMV